MLYYQEHDSAHQIAVVHTVASAWKRAMFRLSFITPIALALLPLLPILWILVLIAPRRIARWRFWTSIVVRSVLFLSLVLALAGTQLIRPVQSLTTIFLVDLSDSIAPYQRDRATQYLEQALHSMPQGDQAGIVAFGQEALVERAPSPLTTLARLNSVPIATRTNIQDAIQLGLALLPADTQKRLVLLSDGGENDGHAVDAARLAAVRQIPIDIVELPSVHGPDALISTLHIPATVREGQEIIFSAVLQSSFDTTGRLQVFLDGQLVGEQPVSIQTGTTQVPLRVPAGMAGFRRLEVRLDAQGDTEPQNNRAVGFTEVQGPPRILLIASDPTRAANLKSTLTLAGVRVDVRGPDQVPAELAQLGQYAATIIVDTPARLLPRPFMDVLPVYV